jgi:hypothetical protein
MAVKITAQNVIKRIMDLTELSPAELRVDSSAAARAIEFLRDLHLPEEVPQPACGTAHDNGVSLEWSKGPHLIRLHFPQYPELPQHAYFSLASGSQSLSGSIDVANLLSRLGELFGS